MINRRKMFGFAVLPLAAVGGVANNVPAIAATSKKDDSQTPENAPIITLQAQKIKQQRSDDPYTISFTSYENTGPQLGISVGKDGHMWLKINDEWKRVKVE